MPEVDLLVVGVDEDDARLIGARLGVLHRAVGDQDHQVARMHQMRCGTVDPDHTAAALTGDRIGDQPGAVVDVDDGDLLALEQVGGVHQIGVDGHRPDVVQVGLRDRGAVDLRLEHRP